MKENFIIEVPVEISTELVSKTCLEVSIKVNRKIRFYYKNDLLDKLKNLEDLLYTNKIEKARTEIANIIFNLEEEYNFYG